MYKIPARTLFIGKNLIYVPECHSTNDLASQLIHQMSTVEGTLVITNNQTAGRGQHGNTWSSEPAKNLTFSLVLKPAFLLPKDQFYLNIVISLGVYDMLKEALKDQVSIKWPNDLIVKNKKIAGILIENQVTGHRITNSVAGIGINVNQLQFSMPTATSMCLIANNEFFLPDLIETLAEKIEFRYLQLRAGKTNLLVNNYLTDFYWKNEDRVFGLRGNTFEGRIVGIDAIGRLQIQQGTEIKTFGVKELTFER